MSPGVQEAPESDGTSATVDLPPIGAERATIPPGAAVARYVVLGCVGAGAMGVVYKAYDPVLDRAVALKLLHGGGGDAKRERVLREAQALAQVAHPNVIAIHDVGVVGDDVFLATEFVVGERLDHWLRAETRAADAIVRAFREAGEGLAAAHRAGLVHRDFKPANVVVGRDGRIRVLDFGLARAVSVAAAGARSTVGVVSGGAAGTMPDPAALASPRLVDAELTHAGHVAGTPRYMAPEQVARAQLTPAADQFAFCVALWEALAGQHPFLDERGRLASDGAPGGTLRVPRRIRHALERGLRTNPAERWASIEALLAELRRTRALAGPAAVALASIAAFALVTTAMRRPPADPCAGGEARLTGVWDARVAADAADAFEKTGWPGASAAFTSVRAALDAYTQRWVAAEHLACVAARAEGGAASPAVARRAACLDRRLAEVRAATALLAAADRPIAARGASLVASLGDLDVCADADVNARGPALPSDPALRSRVVALQADLERASVLRGAGRVRDARQALETDAAEARKTGYDPLIAEALVRLGEVEGLDGDAEHGLASVNEGTELAGRVADDSLFATALLARIELLTGGNGRPQDALDLRPIVAGAVTRVGVSPRLRTRLHTAFARTYDELGRYDEAASEAREAVRLAEHDFGKEALITAEALRRLASVERLAGARDEARRDAYDALARYERLLGHDHPELYDPLLDAASAESSDGDVHAAEALIRRAIALMEAALPGHPRLTHAYRRLGSNLLLQGRSREAEPALEKAAAFAREASPLPVTELADIYGWLGDVVRDLRGIDAARAHYEEMRAFYRQSGRPMDPFFGESLALWGEAECRAGHVARASALFDEARPILGSRDDLWRVKLLISEAGCMVTTGRAATAIPLAEEAVRRLAPTSKKDDLADARYVLARALWSTGARSRALAEAREASAALAGSGRVRAQEIDAWIAAR